MVGHRLESGNPTRDDVYVFRPRAEQKGRNLTAEADLFVDAAMNSDLFSPPAAGVLWSPDGAELYFNAPVEGSYELWRVRLDDARVERLTKGRHMLVEPLAGRGRLQAGGRGHPWHRQLPRPTSSPSRSRPRGRTRPHP